MVEREISDAARRLGENIQKVVLDAKINKQLRRPSMKHMQNNWRDALLDILGGADSDEDENGVSNDGSNGDGIANANATGNNNDSSENGNASQNNGDVGTTSSNGKDPGTKTSTAAATKNPSQRPESDLDKLLRNSHCDKFILRCMENELPPNLIHCMRLLRVLELKNSSTSSRHLTKDANGQDASRRKSIRIKAVSKRATEKVNKLLCLLCGDPSVGEQLRPHLFGLLALPGARYPPNAVHVAWAASDVIVAFAEKCLSSALVWFLHERKMIVHMTDDAKELCGMSSVASGSAAGSGGGAGGGSSSNATGCLYGLDAEEHGLWLIALTSIIHMVRQSCFHSSMDLLHDFQKAGGFHVLRYAMAHSEQGNLKKLLQLGATLCYCKSCSSDNSLQDDTSYTTAGTNLTYGTDVGDLGGLFENDENFVTNPAAFDVIDDLMERSVPLLACYSDQGDDVEMVINHRDDLRTIAKFSVELSLDIMEKGYEGGEERLDRNIYGTEIIVCTMQIYSDHPSNFSVIEGKYNVLTKYLLAFPTFDKIEVKHAILRTLEYAVTGLPQADCWKPLSAACEMFFSLCKFILRMSVDKERGEKDKEFINNLREDFQLLGETLEKLLQLDESAMGLIMLEAGVMGEVLHEIMSLLIMVPPRGEDGCDELNLEGIDDVYCGVCRIIDLIINSTAGMTEVTSPRLDSPNKTVEDPGSNRSIELDALLVTGMSDLSPKACSAAILVFETKMRFAESEALMGDLGVIVGVLNKLVDSISSAKSKQDNGTKNSQVILGCEILDMLKRILGAIDSAQDAFRIRGGFEVLLRLLFCLEDSEHNSTVPDDGNEEIEYSDAILAMVETVYAVFDAATKISSSSSSLASSRAVDLLGEDSTGISKNREYITANGFYESLVKALRGLGLLDTPQHALAIMNLSLGLLHPKLRITLENNESNKNPVAGIQTLRNSDAAKLVLGMAISLPKDKEFRSISEYALNVLIHLCSPNNAGTTLEEIANCGLCRTLISDDGFSFIFDDLDHPLYSRFVTLLRRVASFKMSYMDFVALLRFIAYPLLTSNQASVKDRSEVRLPLISSSFRNVEDRRSIRSSGKSEILEKSINIRLKTLSMISNRADRVARCNLGGTDLNKIYHVKDKGDDTGLDDRLYTMAEEGFTKFIEIDKLQARTKRPVATESSNPAGANLWSPANTSGFSYSLWMRLPDSKETLTGNVCVFDISSNMTGASEKKATTSGRQQFISIWYDLLSQGFNIIFTGSTKPICFPASPLSIGTWHHILITYQPPKRSVLSRKAVIGLCVDGKPLEVDIKIDAVALPPTSIMYVGVPNPILAFSGIIRGSLPTWELGSMLLLSRILGPRDAVSMYAAGPDFHGQFWGDRPQRLSLSATATSVLSMLAEGSEKGGVAYALKRRSIPEIEAASHVMRDKVTHSGQGAGADSVMLSSAGLFCNLPPEYIICAFHPSSSTSTMRENSVAANKGHFSRRLVNVAEIHSTNDLISSDAVVYGKGSVIRPISFGDNVQWLGGPNVLLPILNAAKTSTTIALTLRVIRECVHRHIPNLEMLHAGGGYRMIALLLIQKNIIDAVILEHCFSLAVHRFDPEIPEESRGEDGRKNRNEIYSWRSSEEWALVDLDALKYLIKNHQVWNLQSSGPDMTLRTMSLLIGLVSSSSNHGDFNSRRLHLLGMVKWTIHLMIEIAELYTYGKLGAEISKDVGSEHKATNELLHTVLSAYRSGWLTKTLTISSVTVGGDPGVPVLLACKMFLRRILAHMLTPDDLGEIAGAVIYTLKKDVTHEDVAGQLGYEMSSKVNDDEDPELSMGSVIRIYLLRLLEELVVDGVNEISSAPTGNMPQDSDHGLDNIQDLSSKEDKGKNAQLFLSAFSNVLTPTWFTCILEGCRDESSASASFRLLIIMLQNSPSFKKSFEASGGFAPLVLSIPKFSTSTSITLAMLSQLLHAPLLHLPCFGSLDPEQLCAIFDTESDDQDLILQENSKGGLETNATSTCGIFSLLAECLGRNIQLGAADNELGTKARQTNEAVFGLLTHRHTFSSAFQTFCRTQDFLEPMAQALCLVHNDRLLSKNAESLSRTNSKCSNDGTFYDWPSEVDATLARSDSKDSEPFKERRGSLVSMDLSDHSPTKRFVGNEKENGGIGLVRLIRHVIHHVVMSGPKAVELISALFRAFPIFASSDEVEAFHMVLIEQCHIIVEDTLQRGELIALANCIGISSVLLDRLLMGFFTSEPILEAFHTILSTLKAVSDPDSYASRTLQKEDPDNIVRLNAAHCARLTCLVALQRSKPAGPWDPGDEILQRKIITGINKNLQNLLYATPSAAALSKKKNENNSTPAPGSRLHNFWQSASLKRCDNSSDSCKFPDISEVAEPDRAFVVAIMSELHSILLSRNQSLREETAFLIKSMLKLRNGIMSDLFVKDIPVPVAGGVVKHVDLLNGGGFGALLLHNIGPDTNDESIEHLRLQTFFDWIEVNASDVIDVFQEISNEALECFPSIFSIKVPSPEDAIDLEQKEMLMRITSKEKSDKTMVGRQERIVLAQISNERTDNSQAVWKRQGLDDLSSGAMMWKSLLRQLKGSRSVWEGGSRPVKRLVFSKDELMTTFKNPLEIPQNKTKPSSLIRWKLDMTEGFEHQRRKLLPNYEFYGLYNVDETFDRSDQESNDRRKSLDNTRTDLSFQGEQRAKPGGLYVDPESVVATADLLKKMQLGKTTLEDIEDLDDEGDAEETFGRILEDTDDEGTMDGIAGQDSLASVASSHEMIGDEIQGDIAKEPASASDEYDEYSDEDEEFLQQHHHYDLITGLLQAGDVPEKSYNVERCTGIDVYKALLIRCRNALYIIDGFEQSDEGGLKGNINRVEKTTSTFQVSIRNKKANGVNGDDTEMKTEGSKEETDKKKLQVKTNSSENSRYQHRCKRLSYEDLYAVYKRRYQLQPIALEFYDTYNNGSLIAFANVVEREEVLNILLHSSLPNSIFNTGAGPAPNYEKFMKSLRAKITNQWVQGKMTNFDFLMHLNSFAGRSYNDLTQYPVFPWVIADYDSDEIDLNNPSIYRDLSKPMGALGLARAEQFKERYEALDNNFSRGDEPPPFHYGTHYSCAAYVLNYLLRMEPFSRLALSLQGGKFDLADRLFTNIGSSWKSASRDNLQDVRELIPEFFYLPEFLENKNSFDFGVKQDGTTVDDVILPPWAKGDPRRFVRINRQVSDYGLIF